MEWFTQSWEGWPSVVAVTASAYAVLLLSVRLAGRRTVAQLSAFDAIVTIALGSLLASVATAPSPTFGRYVVALVTLLVLQVTVARIRLRLPATRRILDFEPEHVVRDGSLHLPDGPLSVQLTTDELRSELRKRGVLEIEEGLDVIIEPHGGISLPSVPDDHAEPAR